MTLLDRAHRQRFVTLRINSLGFVSSLSEDPSLSEWFAANLALKRRVQERCLVTGLALTQPPCSGRFLPCRSLDLHDRNRPRSASFNGFRLVVESGQIEGLVADCAMFRHRQSIWPSPASSVGWRHG